MGNLFDRASIEQIVSPAYGYFSHHVFAWAMAAQIVFIGCALLLAHKISAGMRAWLRRQ
jgi:hypothetical protein